MNKKEEDTMKKLITTATAMAFALGLTVAAQAQSTVEKPKNTPVPVQKVTTGTQETAKEVAKPEAAKVTATGAQKADKAMSAKKQETKEEKKDKDVTANLDKKTGKEVKTMAAPEKKSGTETPKADKQ
jgi:hypothetical protein